MKFIDLFAGIGGFRYGLEACNLGQVNDRVRGKTKNTQEVLPDNNTKDIQRTIFSCVYSNEWDRYASRIYAERFNDRIDTRDIRTVNADEIPDFDLLCAGFPCQAFSIAGKRRGFEDTRGTLFFEIARIAQHKRPRYLLLENVKGLLSHESGKTFSTILGVLSDLGYRCEWQVLNSKYFGVPQNRERVFIIGHLGGGSGRKVFPIGQGSKGNNETCKDGEFQQENIANALEQRDYKDGTNFIKESQKLSDAMRVRDTDGVSSTLKGLGGGLGAKTGLYATGTRIRRLTPTECERLQGFPDGWTEGISDTQRYKCLGNAVTTNVVTAIGKQLKK